MSVGTNRIEGSGVVSHGSVHLKDLLKGRLAARRICWVQCITGSVTEVSLTDRGGPGRRRREQERDDGNYDQHKGSGQHSFLFRTLPAKDGTPWLVVFTSHKAYVKGPTSEILSNFIDMALYACLENDAPGIIINPWDSGFMLPRDAIEAILLADRGKTAGKEDWKTEPMPEQHEEFTMRRHITQIQMRFLRRGNIPQEMEDNHCPWGRSRSS